jgi:hypothetical protein
MKAGQMDRGLTCRRCGSQRPRVVYTRRRIGGVQVRRRECRRCRERFTTWERPIGRGKLSSSKFRSPGVQEKTERGSGPPPGVRTSLLQVLP